MKISYSALLLMLLSLTSSAHPVPLRLPLSPSHQYHPHCADTAESPDEFMRSPLRELRR
ncbi:hypothetical protein [Rosenbergiella nectarea]|uniref:hypothetical protein n=1 Tax=Rosenbergiella nectarea TaxID=988801 RepID=UPI001BDB686C|nr:hypothetical protein [Rosenbergiella nectarea]MBT0730180.1 hypothetical protein [Rosenbergiella nectarea subsp. apis]